MITADEIVENYDNFDRFMASLPIDESQTQLPALCEDLGIDSDTTLALCSELNIDFVTAATFFHGFVYAVWLLREKKGR